MSVNKPDTEEAISYMTNKMPLYFLSKLLPIEKKHILLRILINKWMKYSMIRVCFALCVNVWGISGKGYYDDNVKSFAENSEFTKFAGNSSN